MSKITMYASYTDEEIIRLAEDRFFSNDLVLELVQRFDAGQTDKNSAESLTEYKDVMDELLACKVDTPGDLHRQLSSLLDDRRRLERELSLMTNEHDKLLLNALGENHV